MVSDRPTYNFLRIATGYHRLPGRTEGRPFYHTGQPPPLVECTFGAAALTTAHSSHDAPPEGARRRVSLTFRPGEGLLLTGMDGSVEEIEPNFDLNV